ncbi:MAG: signal recognition particle-docking protein FtsY [Bacillota bacterium]
MFMPANLYNSLKKGLARTGQHFSTQLSRIFRGKSPVSRETWDELEAALIMADLGVDYTGLLIQRLKARLREGDIVGAGDVREALSGIILEDWPDVARPWPPDIKTIIFILGVNGVGKTTTIGKLAGQLVSAGKKVLIAAGDTFRAAAIDQLAIWAEKAGAGLVAHREGADPGAVVYDAVHAADARRADVLLVDTAGRLHNKVNLMEELKKMHRIAVKEAGEYLIQNWLVLDATTGQNALAQAGAFQAAVRLDGFVMTKLDGTAKGGIALAVLHTLKIPLLFAGIGEGMEDLKPVEPENFIRAIAGEGGQ